MITLLILTAIVALLALLLGLALRKRTLFPEENYYDPDWDTDDAVECGQDVDAW